MGDLALAVSVAMLGLTSGRLAARWGRDPGERGWVFLNVSALQLGALVGALSVVRQLRPEPWLGLQAVLLGAVLVGTRRPSAKSPRREESPRPAESGASPGTRLLTVGLTLGLGGLILLSALERWKFPVAFGLINVHWDEGVYHTPRVLYWIQHKHALPYEANTIYQTIFSFGSELFFLWGVLFTRSEWAGRLLFWLGYPASVWGIGSLLRVLGLRRAWVLGGSLLWAATPIVYSHSALTLKPEVWHAVFVLGTGFWTVRAVREKSFRTWAWAGLTWVLSLNVKFTTLAVGAVLLGLGLWEAIRHRVGWASLRGLLAGSLIGTVLSGLWIPLVGNQVRYGHPLGPQSLWWTHRSDLSLGQMYVHTVRFLLVMTDWHVPPGIDRYIGMSRLPESLATFLGANRRLPLEEICPGLCPFSVEKNRIRHIMEYSVGGMAWVAVLVGMGIGAALEAYRRREATPRAALVWLALVLTASIVLGVRWLTAATVPLRFLVPAYALGVVLVTSAAAEWADDRRMRRLGCGLALAGTVADALLGIAPRFQVYQYNPRPFPLPPGVDTIRLLSYIPRGAHLLLVNGWRSLHLPEYWLFDPEAGYPNRVIPWGTGAFDPVRMERLIQREQVTHVVVAGSASADATTPLSPAASAWLARRPGIREIPVLVPGFRLFVVEPHLRVLGLHSRDPACQYTLTDGWYLWEGRRRTWWRWSPGRGAVRFRTERDLTVDLWGKLIAARPGDIAIVIDGRPQATVAVTWGGFGPFRVRIGLTPGEHTVEFVARFPPVRGSQDSRDLAFGVQNLLVRSVDGTVCLGVGTPWR
jgi:hypothetical protein